MLQLHINISIYHPQTNACVYVPGTQMTSIFEESTPQNKAFLKQKKDHLGSSIFKNHPDTTTSTPGRPYVGRSDAAVADPNVSTFFRVSQKMEAAGVETKKNKWVLHIGCLILRHFECKDGEKNIFFDEDVEDLWSIFEINEACMLNLIYHWSFLMVTCLTKGTRIFCKISMYLSYKLN